MTVNALVGNPFNADSITTGMKDKYVNLTEWATFKQIFDHFLALINTDRADYHQLGTVSNKKKVKLLLVSENKAGTKNWYQKGFFFSKPVLRPGS